MEFLAAILSYPTVVYTVLLGVVLVYWSLAIIGLVDFEHSGPDLDLEIGGDVDMSLEAGDAGDAAPTSESHHLMDGEAHIEQVSTLASYLVALGLGGVPFSIVASLLVLFAWLISSIAALWVLAWVPTDILRFLAGSVLLLASLAFAIPPTAFCVRPLRRLFVTHNAISNASLVGQECVILTGTVDEKFGRAEVPAHGAGYHIRVIAETPNPLKRGDKAIIMEYDEAARLYRIQARE
ncbi:MAG: DUF1449 family protein [Zoogloeaceae bacterium]|jgi:hypothetical protein|nr:DUF1449 family protein [Zoogloeaceae bacterium]